MSRTCVVPHCIVVAFCPAFIRDLSNCYKFKEPSLSPIYIQLYDMPMPFSCFNTLIICSCLHSSLSCDQ